MKIKKLKLKNFGAFTDFECEFDGKLTHLVGVNGSGKTTVGLTSIWAGLKGIAERKAGGQLTGERFRFIGTSKASADIELTLHDDVADVDVIIKNHITKATNSISFEAPERYIINPGWLENLLSVAFLSAKNFTALDGKQQALLLGIDTSEHDANIAKLKEDATLFGRQLRAFGTLEEVPKQERVVISELIAKRDTLVANNQELKAKRDSRNESVVLLAERKSLLKELTEDLATLNGNIKDCTDDIGARSEALEALSEIPPDESTDEITQKIANAEATNQQAAAYDTYQTRLKEKQGVEKFVKSNKASQSKAVEKRLAYIKEHDFGFDGLEVDENGRLLLNDRPIKDPHFSKGELELIVSKLYMSLDPELKIRFIDDFELLDEDNQVKIVDALLAEGFQVITAEVGKVATKENTILLRECKKTDSYDTKTKKSVL